jgi:hypothetical protein
VSFWQAKKGCNCNITYIRNKERDEEPTKDKKQQRRTRLSPTKDDGKLSKKRESYTNWFRPHLWPPITIVIKKHGNTYGALHFLKTTFKRPNMPSPYEKLNRACLREWFTTNGELKSNYEHVWRLGQQ